MSRTFSMSLALPAAPRGLTAASWRLAILVCGLTLHPLLGLAQVPPCGEALRPGSRVRVTAPDRQWSGVVTTVIDCKPTALEVAERADVPVELPWDSIARVEVAHRHDLRWPGLAAGLAGGVWLGLTMEPFEEERPCTMSYSAYVGLPSPSCPVSDRVQVMFLGLSIGTVAGYFGGMLIKFDRWELVPTLGGRASLSVRIAF